MSSQSFLPGRPYCVKISHSDIKISLTAQLENVPSSPVFSSSGLNRRLDADKSSYLFRFTKLPFRKEWNTFQTSTFVWSTMSIYMWGNEICIFLTQKKNLKGPQCIPQWLSVHYALSSFSRHSELVNGAITSNMSVLTKTLSHCHWMCLMSNKKPLPEQIGFLIVFLSIKLNFLLHE